MVKVIFDNECSFCISIKNILKKMDIFKIFIWFPSDQFLGNNNHELITDQMIKSSIVVFTSKEKILTEFNACRFIITRIPFFIPVLFFFYIPFLSHYFGTNLYRFIANKRKCRV